jgi:hypothetical protein
LFKKRDDIGFEIGVLCIFEKSITMSITLQEPVNVDELIAIVQRLTDDDKIRLGNALKKEMIDDTLEKLLTAFRTDELDMETITQEVEIVRQERYNRAKNEGNI